MKTHTIANMQSEGTDGRVFFRRQDDSIYAIIGPANLTRLKRARQLRNYLREQRESGVVIKVAGA